MSITLAVGTRLPAYATSMGRVLLAALPDEALEERLARIDVRVLTPRTVKSDEELRKVIQQVRRLGYAVTDQELEQGLRSAAVPIHDASGAVVAALNVSVHASRASMHELRARFLPPAQAAAAAIDAELRKSGIRATAGSAVPSAGAGLLRS
jgi:IclR family pca regulon transcriptional regulator